MKILLFISVVVNFVLLLFLIRKRKTTSAQVLNESQEKEVLIVSDTTKEDLLKSKLDKFKTFASGISHEKNNCEKLLSGIASEVQAVQGALYLLHMNGEHSSFRFHCGYAFYCPESKPLEFEIGEGLIGQVAKDMKTLNLNAAPEGHLPAVSGLGKSTPQYLIISPLLKNGKIIGVIELSAFNSFDKNLEKFIEDALKIITENLNT